MALSPGEARALFERQALLSVRDALDVVQDAQRVMAREPNVVRVRGACVFVVGDIHGQFFDLMRLLDDIGVGDGAVLEERDMQLVFLGDYVDRGAFSSEVMLYLLLLKSLHPTRVWLLRGNHECESISSFYGFRNECRSKYGISAYYHFVSCFQTMPLAALIETSRGRIFCVHGGISPEIRDLAAVDAIDRKREVPTSGALCDLLWSDPALGRGNEPEDISWQANAERGCSFYFSASALFQFLAENDLMAVVRAHEFEEDGLMAHFEGDDYRNLDKRTARDLPPLLTVFSAPNYCDAYGNKGAYLVIRDEPFEWESKHLEAASHPVPSIDGIERSSDIWRQFNQTLPFLPASKEFFDEIVRLSEARAFSSSSDREQKPSFFTNHQSNPVLAPPRTESSPPGDSTADRKRKMTSEIHPQAIRRVLDDEVCKWMQSDDGNLQVFPQQKTFGSRGSCGSLAISGGSDEQSGVLTQQELDMVKLMFSLMDTDGRMVLSAAKISKFVLNILGERISDDVAENYLRALDFDGSGAVEFSDVLSWVATMKINHISVTAHGNSAINWRGLFALARRWIFSRIRKENLGPTSLWLTLACLLRDLYRSKRYRVTASPLLRFLGCVTTLLYAISLIQPESPIMRMLRSFLWTPQNPRRLSK